MSIPKGKSPIDKKRNNPTFNGTENSMERRILTGQWLLPGKSKQETIKALRAWQKGFRIDQGSMEKWYRTQVHDNNPRAGVK